MSIKSPLNYTGNKYRLLQYILPNIPSDKSLCDVFCGGATVGINSYSSNVLFVDNNPKVINLLEFLSKCNFNTLLKDLECIIAKYQLSNSYRNGYSFYKKKVVDINPNNGLKDYNKAAFYKLREDYNNLEDKDTDLANKMLYLLMVYAFNNDIRFNSNGHFNLPCGKTDFNRTNVKKLMDYIYECGNKNINFLCGDFRNSDVQRRILSYDMLYLDPPYLITTAVYNETNRWNEGNEIALLNFLSNCITINKPFILSNILISGNKRNLPLCDWIEDNKDVLEVQHLNYSYASASYNKKHRHVEEKEVLIIFRGV